MYSTRLVLTHPCSKYRLKPDNARPYRIRHDVTHTHVEEARRYTPVRDTGKTMLDGACRMLVACALIHHILAPQSGLRGRETELGNTTQSSLPLRGRKQTPSQAALAENVLTTHLQSCRLFRLHACPPHILSRNSALGVLSRCMLCTHGI